MILSVADRLECLQTMMTRIMVEIVSWMVSPFLTPHMAIHPLLLWLPQERTEGGSDDLNLSTRTTVPCEHQEGTQEVLSLFSTLLLSNRINHCQGMQS